MSQRTTHVCVLEVDPEKRVQRGAGLMLHSHLVLRLTDLG